jgi:DnaJ-class molecular chaperone
MNNDEPKRTKQCPTCEGSGKCGDGSLCPACHGAGEVFFTDFIPVESC